MMWLILLMVGCGPTCKDACQKIYAETLCARDMGGAPPDIMIDACVRQCRVLAVDWTSTDTASGWEEKSTAGDYTWIDCVMGSSCEDLENPCQCDLILETEDGDECRDQTP